MPSVWVNLTDEDRAEIVAHIPRLAKKMAHKKISISSAKAKGRGLQYWVCGRIANILQIPWEQGNDECEIQSRTMGLSGADIILRGKAATGFPFSIECKSSEQLDLVGTINQAISNTPKGRSWLIVHRRKAIPNPIVIMSWDTFEWIWRS